LFNQIEPSLAGMIVGKEKRGYANEVGFIRCLELVLYEV
jgi:hypothetical protein